MMRRRMSHLGTCGTPGRCDSVTMGGSTQLASFSPKHVIFNGYVKQTSSKCLAQQPASKAKVQVVNNKFIKAYTDMYRCCNVRNQIIDCTKHGGIRRRRYFMLRRIYSGRGRRRMSMKRGNRSERRRTRWRVSGTPSLPLSGPLLLEAPLLVGSTLHPRWLQPALFSVAPAPLVADPVVKVVVVQGSGACSELSRSRWRSQLR